MTAHPAGRDSALRPSAPAAAPAEEGEAATAAPGSLTTTVAMALALASALWSPMTEHLPGPSFRPKWNASLFALRDFLRCFCFSFLVGGV